MIWCISIASCGGGGEGPGGTIAPPPEDDVPPPVNVTIFSDPVTILGDGAYRFWTAQDGLNVIQVADDGELAIYQYKNFQLTQVGSPLELPDPGIALANAVYFGDSDSDGYEELFFTDDLLVKRMTYNGVTWEDSYLVHDVETSFSKFGISYLDSFNSFRLLDMDNDGDVDYQFGLFSEGRYAYYWCENLGQDAACSSKHDLDLLNYGIHESGDDRERKYFVDLNNDGIPDIVHHDYYLPAGDHFIEVLFSTAPWEYPIESRLDTDDKRQSKELRFSDLNNDGLADLSVTRSEGADILYTDPRVATLYLNNSGSGFSAPSTILGLPEYSSSISDSNTRTWDAAHDLNLDGAVDYIYFESDKLILVSGYSESEGGFTKMESIELPAALPDDWNREVLLIDLDDDGDQDLLYRTASGSLGYMMNTTI